MNKKCFQDLIIQHSRQNMNAHNSYIPFSKNQRIIKEISRQSMRNSVMLLLELVKRLEIQQFFEHIVEEIVTQRASDLVPIASQRQCPAGSQNSLDTVQHSFLLPHPTSARRRAKYQEVFQTIFFLPQKPNMETLRDHTKISLILFLSFRGKTARLCIILRICLQVSVMVFLSLTCFYQSNLESAATLPEKKSKTSCFKQVCSLLYSGQTDGI